MDPRLEKFFDLSLDLLCIAGMDGLFKKVNPAFTELLGWPESVLLTRPFFDFVHPDDVELTQRELENLTRGHPTIRFENRYECSDGTYKHLRWTSSPDPETGLLYAVARDVSWQKELENQLRGAKEAAEAADLAKSAFLANISHELRTPMSGILGMSDLALERVDDPELERSLEVIRQSSESLLELINDLLDLSKIEAGRIELEPTPFSLRAMVSGAVRSLAVQAHRKGLELTLEVAAELPDDLLGDALRVRQVLVNLIGNAIKFTDQGKVGVRVEDATEFESASQPATDVVLRFVVADTGIGMSPDESEHILEPFWQVRSSPSRTRGGTGLGLAICAQLVELAGGSLEFESEVGVGSTFSFTVVLARGEAAAADAEQIDDRRREELRALKNHRALVVEPRRASRRVLMQLLEQWHVEAESAATLEEAESRLDGARSRGEPFGLLFVACGTSGRGLELAKALAKSEAAADVAMVATLPSVRQTGTRRFCESLGLAGYLVEPVVFEDLRSVLRNIAGLASEPREAARGPRGAAAASLQVLLVEDSAVNQQVITALLESRGHCVVVVGEGEAALAKFASRSFDLVLMDVGLPGRSGPDIAKEMRLLETEGKRRTPILAITADGSPEQRSRSEAAGMDGTLVKPVRSRSLFEAIEGTAARPAASTPGNGVEAPLDRGGVDWSVALEITGGDEALLARIVEAAREEIPELLEATRGAVARGDAESLARAAHTLRGSCRYFGAAEVSDIAERLELAGRRGSLEGAVGDLDLLEAPVERLLEALASRARGELSCGH